jgi:DNA-binding winged helix-turn-helix (wHTH) protein
MAKVSELIFSFGAFELLPARQQLLERGRPLHIGSRAFGLLQALLKMPASLLRKTS